MSPQQPQSRSSGTCHQWCPWRTWCYLPTSSSWRRWKVYLQEILIFIFLRERTPARGNKGGHVPCVSECLEVQARTKDIPPHRSQSPCQILGQGNFLQGAAFWVSVGGWEGRGKHCERRDQHPPLIITSPASFKQSRELSYDVRHMDIVLCLLLPPTCNMWQHLHVKTFPSIPCKFFFLSLGHRRIWQNVNKTFPRAERVNVSHLSS